MRVNKSGVKRGLALEYITLAWNVIGVGIVFYAAYRARSLALAGFGVDSLIEIVASVAVVWELAGVHAARRRIALRIISVSFALLAAYIVTQAVVGLRSNIHPTPSALGMLWLAVTAAAMFALAYGKHRVGVEIDNPVLRFEARVTAVDGLLAVAVLVGLAANALFGWWFADSLAALVIVFYAVREARHTWKESKT